MVKTKAGIWPKGAVCKPCRWVQDHHKTREEWPHWGAFRAALQESPEAAAQFCWQPRGQKRTLPAPELDPVVPPAV